MNKFAVFDIDGTLFRSGLYRELFYELDKIGAIPSELAEATTEKYLQWQHRAHREAFEDFQLAIVETIEQYLTQLDVGDYDQAVARVIASQTNNIYAYTLNLLRQLQQDGYFTIAISGSQQEIVEPFAKHYGFDAWVGQKWVRDGANFTGEIIKTHTDKDKILQELVDAHHLTFSDSYAVGDTSGDIGILSVVDHPIAFNPSYGLYQIAQDKGWTIAVERKNISYTLKPVDGVYQLTAADSQQA